MRTPIKTGDMVYIVDACCMRDTAIGTPFVVGKIWVASETLKCYECGHPMNGTFAQFGKTGIFYPIGWLKKIGDGLPPPAAVLRNNETETIA